MNPGLSNFKLAYEISPIVLTNGIASNAPGGMMPIINLTDGPDANGLGLDQYFAKYVPLPGSTLIANDIGNYPFANQAVAANAIIVQPLKISLMMICPAQSDNVRTYQNKLNIVSSLKASLDQHNLSGGTYIVATPSFIYTNCIMVGMTDASTPNDKQLQNAYRLDFLKPLLSIADAQVTYNTLMNAIANQLPINGQPTTSGLQNTIGSTTATTGNTLIPGNQNLTGTAVNRVNQTAGPQ